MISRLLKFVLPAVLISIVIMTVYSEGKLKDGIYEGRSQSKYTNEPFVAVTRLYITNGNIDSVSFSIIDTSKKEIFDGNYEKHYVGNQEYIDQCRNDWKGINTYPTEFLKTKEIEKVDAISGATWSYNMFISSLTIALKNAKKGN